MRGVLSVSSAGSLKLTTKLIERSAAFQCELHKLKALTESLNALHWGLLRRTVGRKVLFIIRLTMFREMDVWAVWSPEFGR